MVGRLMVYLQRVVNSSAPAANPDDAVHANVVNVCALFGIGITIYYTLFYLVLDAELFFPIILGNLFIIPLYLIPVAINRRGHFYLAKWAFFPIPFYQMVFDTGMLGRGAGTHLFLLALPSLGFAHFQARGSQVRGSGGPDQRPSVCVNPLRFPNPLCAALRRNGCG